MCVCQILLSLISVAGQQHIYLQSGGYIGSAGRWLDISMDRKHERKELEQSVGIGLKSLLRRGVLNVWR